jgi:hypothetical protein
MPDSIPVHAEQPSLHTLSRLEKLVNTGLFR